MAARAIGGFRRLVGAAVSVGTSVAFAPLAMAAEAVPGAELQRLQEQEMEAQRARTRPPVDVFTKDGKAARGADFDLPDETPCHVIREIDWTGDAPPAWLRERAATLIGRCVGTRGMQVLERELKSSPVDYGLITSQVPIPEQTLFDGILHLHYLHGYIGTVQDDGTVGWWRTVLPVGPGGTLNQRDLDQALENMRRLTGQADAEIELRPGAKPGEADLRLRPGKGKRWHGYVGADNAGLQSTGRNQVNAGLSLDSPLFLYDQLSLAWNSNAAVANRHTGTRSSSVSYNVPLGYWTLFADATQSSYRQTIAGFYEPIVYEGKSRQISGGVGLVPYRGANYKGNAGAKIWRKWSSNRINDYDVGVQHRDVVGYDLTLGHRHYLGKVVVEGSGTVRATLPGMSNDTGVMLGDPNWNGRSTLLLANLTSYVPFQMLGQQFSYQGTWRWQHAKTKVLPSDYFMIGNRYSVRGFDGQMTLAAENGWSLRNDLAWSMGNSGQQLYAGVDAGRVEGRALRHLEDRTLVGAVLGLRGRIPMPYGAANYDISLGRPLKKPAALRADPYTVAMSIMVSI